MKKNRIFISVLLLTTALLSGCQNTDKAEIMDAYIVENVTETETEFVQEDIVDSKVQLPNKNLDMQESTQASGGCVYLCGAVTQPGVYEFVYGERLWDVLKKAGGFSEEASTDYWNLAAYVEDGEMFYVPTIKEVQEDNVLANETAQGTNLSEKRTSQKGSQEEARETDGLLDINTATKEAFMTIPGIGETKASAIVAYRQAHGDFSSKEDIKQVSGIKDATYELMKDYITVGGR